MLKGLQTLHDQYEKNLEASKFYCNSCHLGTPGGATYGRGRSQFAALGILVFFSKATICYLETWENDFGRTEMDMKKSAILQVPSTKPRKMCDNPCLGDKWTLK